MADDTLHRLEGLRAEAVERARRELSEAQAACDQAELARRAAQQHEVEQLAALSVARRAFARVDDVFRLRVAELDVRARQRAVRAASERVARTSALRALAAQQLACRRDALRVAELARRVVRRSVDQRAADVSLRTERRQEDERDDQHRASASARTRRDFPNA